MWLIYTCSTGDSTALLNYLLVLLARSQRGLVPAGRSRAKAYPYLLPLTSHEAALQYREALPCLNLERVDEKKAFKKPMCQPSPNGMRRKGKEKGKSADGPDPNTYNAACSG